MLKTVVFYHDDSDGLASALSLFIKHGTDATYIPVQYKQPVPNVTLDKETQLFIVDFSYPLPILLDLQSKVQSILVIDHHETAQKQLQDFDCAIFDIEKSGASLCWETIHPNVPVPKVIELVADRDLWKFELQDSKAFEAGIRGSGKWKDLSYWERLTFDTEELQKIIDNGNTILEPQNAFIENFVKSRKFKVAKFRGLRCAIFNTTYLISDLSSAVYQQTQQPVDMTMSYFVTANGDMVFSLRTSVDGDIDVGAIAVSLGGGGQTKSAGFSMPLVQGAEFVANLLKE